MIDHRMYMTSDGHMHAGEVTIFRVLGLQAITHDEDGYDIDKE